MITDYKKYVPDEALETFRMTRPNLWQDEKKAAGLYVGEFEDHEDFARKEFINYRPGYAKCMQALPDFLIDWGAAARDMLTWEYLWVDNGKGGGYVFRAY